MAEDALFPLEEGVRGDAKISDDGLYRYELSRTWTDRPIQHHATFVMLNPSTADASDDDPTIQRCMKFARAWGMDGIRVVNLYAFRASKPEAMWQAFAEGIDIIGPENQTAINVALLRAYNTCSPVVAAWGNHGASGRVAWMVRHARDCGVSLKHMGTTLSGAPKHPLARGRHRIPDDVALRDWVPGGAS